MWILLASAMFSEFAVYQLQSLLFLAKFFSPLSGWWWTMIHKRPRKRTRGRSNSSSQIPVTKYFCDTPDMLCFGKLQELPLHSPLLECRPVVTSWSVSMGDQRMNLSRIFGGQGRFPLLFFLYHHLEIISQSIKPTVERLSYIFHDSSISRDPHLLTRLCEKFPSKT